MFAEGKLERQGEGYLNKKKGVAGISDNAFK